MNNYYLPNGHRISGIEHVSEFTRKVKTYTIYLNVDSFTNSGGYYVWAEEIKMDARSGFVSVAVPTGNKSNANMSIERGTITIMQNQNGYGFPMDTGTLLNIVENAMSRIARNVALFLRRYEQSHGRETGSVTEQTEVCAFCKHYDFRRVCIKLEGEVDSVALVGGHLRELAENERFRFCPACGRKLESTDFVAKGRKKGE